MKRIDELLEDIEFMLDEISISGNTEVQIEILRSLCEVLKALAEECLT